MTIVDRMFDKDRHTLFLFKKKRECKTEAERDEVEWEIHGWWREWRDTQLER